MTKFSYKKAERLKSKKLIAQLFADGKNIFKYPIKIVYLEIPKGQHPVYFTTSVSKRVFKKAITRNRIKRLIKEAYRLNKLILSEPMDKSNFSIAMMAIYVGKEELPFQKVEKTVKHLMKVLANSIDKTQRKVL